MSLEGVAGPQQVGHRYDIVVRSPTTSEAGRCGVETGGDEIDSFSIEVVPGN